MTATQPNTAPIPRTFTQTLDSLRYGELSEELTKELKDLVAKCTSTGRAGSLTLTIALKPGKGGQIEVFDELKLKEPKPERGSSLMFATPENNLQRDDPRQMKLPGIRVVDSSGEAPVDLRQANG